MNITTTKFGSLEVNKKEVWHFISPILGFEELTRYIMVSSNKNSPFEFFQSLEDEKLSFVIADPFLFFKEYEFTINQRCLDSLHIESKEEVLIRSIVTVRSPSDISINLKAPIVLNLKTKEASQLILDNSEYGTRHSIVENFGEEANHVDTIEE